MEVGGFLRDFEPFRTASSDRGVSETAPLRTVSRPRSAQGELLLRYPRILETRVIINRPSDVAVADPECKADSHLNCVQARGNPLMGVCRRGNQSSSALQFVVSRGLREVLLALRGRLYQRDVVSEFGPKTWPRRRDRETRVLALPIFSDILSNLSKSGLPPSSSASP